MLHSFYLQCLQPVEFVPLFICKFPILLVKSVSDTLIMVPDLIYEELFFFVDLNSHKI
jgi:hypothetical protein